MRNRMRKSTGKAKSLRGWRTGGYNYGQRAEQGKGPVRLYKFDLIDLSDDFADVDLREELCCHSRPKKEKFGGGLLRFIDFLESAFYGGEAVIDFPVSAKILIILR